MKPRIFIGSSSEGLFVANYVKNYYKEEYDCVIWNDNVFKYNNSFLETLLNASSLFDFGLLIFTKDDYTIVRDEAFEEPRDNVLFEYGLFLGRLGVERAYVLAEESVKIPSDFLGITLVRIATFTTAEGKKEVDAEKSNMELVKLKKQIDDYYPLGHLGLLPSTVMAISYFEDFVKLVSEWIYDNLGAVTCEGKKFLSAKLNIVIPSKLDTDIKKQATLYYRNHGLSELTINGTDRVYPIHFKEDAVGKSLEIYDMPSILNGIDKAIELYFKRGYIGKSENQRKAEKREMSGFARVLEILIQQDAFCRNCVEIIIEE